MSYDQENQGNFNNDSTYDSPSGDQFVPGGDSTLSGSYGGSGTGRAGGYTGSESRVGRQGQQSLDKGDEYCDTDPGVAGNRGGQNIQDVNVPGVGQEGGGYDSACDQSIGDDSPSRGYERDGQGVGAGTGRGPTGKSPSTSSKLIGGVEKMTGKLLNNPELEAKGEQRKTGF